MSDTSLRPDAQRLLAEVLRRKQLVHNILSDSFLEQQAVLSCTDQLQAIFCTRRAGKTYGEALLFAKTAVENPGCNMLYIGLTFDSARRNLVKDCMDPVLEKHVITAKFNKSLLRYEFSNGSSLQLLGLDANRKERKKALGGKYKLIVIDEAQDFEIDLKELVFIVLKPSVADLRGTIILAGTPSNKTFGLFFDITTGNEPGWTVHKWSAEDNPHMRTQWRAEIAGLREIYPNLDDLSWFKQQYLGLWVIDHEKLVYKFNPDYLVDKLPESKDWRGVLGVDLGWDDPTAFSLWAYSRKLREAFCMFSWKRRHMLLSDVERELKLCRDTYPFITHYIIDNAAKQSVEEMKNRTQIPLEAAEKQGKYDFIQIFNSDMKAGFVKFLREATEPLQAEYKTLVWDEKYLEKGVHKELASCHNHCADSALYPYRFLYNWIRGAEETSRPKNETEQQELIEREEIERLRVETNEEWWEKSLP